MAINLPIRVIGYTPLQDGVKYREELTTDSYDDMYFGFSRLHPALEIGTIMWHSSNSYYGEHPDKPSHILIAGMAHPGMFLRMPLPNFLLSYIVVSG
jgi:hypothetical protein